MHNKQGESSPIRPGRMEPSYSLFQNSCLIVNFGLVAIKWAFPSPRMMSLLSRANSKLF